MLKCESENKVHLKACLGPQGFLHSNPIVISRILHPIVHKGESALVLDVVAKREKRVLLGFLLALPGFLVVRSSRASRS